MAATRPLHGFVSPLAKPGVPGLQGDPVPCVPAHSPKMGTGVGGSVLARATVGHAPHYHRAQAVLRSSQWGRWEQAGGGQ